MAKLVKDRIRRVVLGSAVLLLGLFGVVRPAPATIQEQRNRLPPPAECTDPVIGVWKSHQYDPSYRDWTVFMLEIRRVEDSETELTGRITNHSWDAGPDQEEPAACGASGQNRWEVSMDARGTVVGNRIQFGGVGQWRLDRVICNGGPGGYNLDNFTGTIEPELNEFQSINNDGGRAVNDPTVFRRIRCFRDSLQSPTVVTTPPPFYPAMRPGGCSL